MCEWSWESSSPFWWFSQLSELWPFLFEEIHPIGPNRNNSTKIATAWTTVVSIRISIQQLIRCPLCLRISPVKA